MYPFRTRSYEGAEYVNARYVHQESRFCIASTKSGLEVIKLLEVPDSEWIRAAYGDNNSLKIAPPTSLTPKTYIKHAWLQLRCSELGCEDDSREVLPRRSSNGKAVEALPRRSSKSKAAPPLLDIPESERLSLPGGKKAEIETRGYRNIGMCYFRASEVGAAFGIRKIRNTLAKDHYILGEDYDKFKLLCADKNGNNVLREVGFLTMRGIIQTLARSHSNERIHFLDWVSKLALIALMGTTRQRIKLASKLTGIDIRDVELALKKTSKAMNGMYFINVGTVGDLAEDYDLTDLINPETGKNYDRTDIIIKIGMSKDIGRRISEHRNAFSKMKGACPKVMKYEELNRYFTREAESELKIRLAELGTPVPGHTEIFAIGRKTFGRAIDKFKEVVRQHPADNDGLQLRVCELETANEDLQERCEFLEYEVDSLEEKVQAQRDLHTAEMTSLKEELETQKEVHAAELASLREELQVLRKQAVRERTDRKDLGPSDSRSRQTARSSRT